MGQQPDKRQSDQGQSNKRQSNKRQSDRSTQPQRSDSPDSTPLSNPSPTPSHPRPAFEEIVVRPSYRDVKQGTAQSRNRLIRPTASSNRADRSQSRIWSSVEELPSKRSPQSPPNPSLLPPSPSRQSSPQPTQSHLSPLQPSPAQPISPQQPQPSPPTESMSPPSPPPQTTATGRATPTATLPTPVPLSPVKVPAVPGASQKTPANDKAPYTEKTQRIVAWSNLLRSLQPFIWAAVILVVVVPLVGKALLFYSSTTPVQRTIQPLTEVMVPAIPKRANLDQALVDAVQTAHASAQSFAQDELDDWEVQLEGRVDHFLDWYFGYLNQKKMEFMTPLVWVSSAAIHSVNPKQMNANEAVVTRFTEEFQKQFAKQVLVPQTAQIQLENLTIATVNHYLLALRQNMEQVQVKYRIPQGQWDRYLSDISTTIQDTEGNLSNLSLKMLVGGSGYLLTKPLVLATVGKIGSKVSSKVAGTAAAKVAAKTGGTVAAELGTSLIDPIVGVGIFIWDIWDYQHTVALERPVLKTNLVDYLQGVEQSLLHDPETGVLSAIAQLEQGIFQSL